MTVINGLKHGLSLLPNGISLHFVEKGTPDGIPVLFVHGFPDSWNSFRPVLDALSPSFHAFAIDLRGFGDSSKPLGGYSIKDFSEDIAAFIEVQHLKKITLVGHSMGSFIAQHTALHNPAHVEKLVLIGAASKGKENHVLSEALDIVNTLSDPIGETVITEFQSGTIHQKVNNAFFQTIIQESLKAPVRVWKQALKALTEADYSDELIRIGQETWLVWGANDAIFSKKEQENLLTGLPNATLSIYKNAGHSLNWEQPERLAKELTIFLSN